MPSFEIQHSSSKSRGVTKRVGNTLASIGSQTDIDIARVEAAADVQCAKVDAVGAVGQRAMQGTAFLAQIEGQLGQAVPLAVTRLQAIGDLSALAMGMVVTDTVTRLRRL